MKRSPALPWVLSILDDGLRLYRRNFAGFVLVGATVLVPLAALGLIITALIETQLGSTWSIISTLFLPVIQYPIYLFAYLALSRASAMALDGEPIRVGAALRARPGRVFGMACYNVLFTLISGVFSGGLILSIACPLLYASTLGAGLLGAFGGSSSALGAAGAVFIVLFGLIILATVLVFGAMLASQVYAVQAFALEQRSFSASLSRSIDLLTYRLGRNLLALLGAGAISGTLSLAYLGTLLAGGQSLLSALDVELSIVGSQALTTAATTASQVLLLPPLPIWMVMLHRALAAERDAPELQAAIAEWRTNIAEETKE
jgi:hypothetical protein